MKPKRSSSKQTTVEGDTDSFYTPVASGTENRGGRGNTDDFFTAVASSGQNGNEETSLRDSKSSTSSASVASSVRSEHDETSLGDSTPAVAVVAPESEFLIRREPETPAVTRTMTKAPVERALRVEPGLPKNHKERVEFLTRRSPNVDIYEDDSGEDDSSKRNTFYETPDRRDFKIHITPLNNMLAAMDLNEACKCGKPNQCTVCCDKY